MVDLGIAPRIGDGWLRTLDQQHEIAIPREQIPAVRITEDGSRFQPYVAT